MSSLNEDEDEDESENTMSEDNAMVKYGAYEKEEAEKEAIDLEKTSGEFLKLHIGKNIVRFLPPPLGKKSPFKIVMTHFVSVPGSDTSVSIPCQVVFKKPCPLCSWASQLKAKGDPVSLEKGKDLSAKRRVYANAIDRENPEAGPQIISFGKTIHEALVALRTDEDVGGDFTHPVTGYDIQIVRSGSGRNDTEYKVFRHKHDSKLDNLEWIEVQHDLDQFCRSMTPEEIKAKITGEASERAPAKPTKKAGPVAQARRTVEQDAVTAEVVGDDEDVPF